MTWDAPKPSMPRHPRLTLPRLPWAFADEATEHAFNNYRGETAAPAPQGRPAGLLAPLTHPCPPPRSPAPAACEWARGADQWVAFPWFFLWVAIIARHWPSLTWPMLARSSAHCAVTCAPAYTRRLLGEARYLRYRSWIVAAALVSYTLHPGGGLYRDAVMINAAEHTGLDAINLFVRLLIGSRTLFWLILILGYDLPPAFGVPFNAACLAVMTRLRPSQPFCATMQTPATRPLFHTIAASLPLLSAVSVEHPALAPGADVCNPLVHWMQVTLGFLLPACVHLVGDYSARLAWARRRARALAPADRGEWARRGGSAFSPWALAAMLLSAASTTMWFGLMWGQMLPPRVPVVAGTAP